MLLAFKGGGQEVGFGEEVEARPGGDKPADEDSDHRAVFVVGGGEEDVTRRKRRVAYG